jgi:hypothetical protein
MIALTAANATIDYIFDWTKSTSKRKKSGSEQKGHGNEDNCDLFPELENREAE